MARAFDITTTSPTLRLDSSRRGEVAFTVTNSLGRPVRGRAVIVPEGTTPPGWFSIVDETERDFPRDGTHVFTVKTAVPASQAGGEHGFHLLVVDQANPDEHFAEGPPVSFRVPAPVIVAKKKIPWWIPAAAAAAVLIMVLVGVLVSRRGPAEEEGPGTGGSGPPVTEAPAQPPPPAPVLEFNGTSTYVDLGEPLALEITGPITLEAWIRPTSADTVQNIVARGYTATNASEEIALRVSGRYYQVGSYMTGKPYAFAYMTLPVQDLNRWVHVAGVYDGQKWKLYRNGELMSEVDQAGGGAYPLSARWAIGAKGGGGERFFKGRIRDVRIWSVARTQEQLEEGMKKPPDPSEEGLAGYWPMNEGSGRRVVDQSGNEAHGFIQGGKWMIPETAQDGGTPPPSPPPQQ
ncbi:LamG domain-containing protein [Pyxidicoccus xibeiensis]|uniref:LamG domain-containing protein n=1 Tax=Pyxidicoccus xibeiensis TaxID=2906759 RepID=UPI0020A81DC3|nr:LamG domain-containing protein [Pyxidicoccus xibeiensis]MCP3136328.1 LamG domain-containing protein [Pyxidicoccus xibeiensis]